MEIVDAVDHLVSYGAVGDVGAPTASLAGRLPAHDASPHLGKRITSSQQRCAGMLEDCGRRVVGRVQGWK